MFGKKDTEALVAGAGPVGLWTGWALAERGIDFQIVDSQWQTASRSYALALHPRTLDLFERLGLAEELVGQGHPVRTLAFYEGTERLGELRFSELPGPYPYLLVLPQTALEKSLERRLREKKRKVLWNHRLGSLELQGMPPIVARVDKLGKDSTGYGTSETGWVIDRSTTVRAGFVLGADGHRSAVRRALDVAYPLVGDAELFAVFEIVARGVSFDEARVVFGEGGTASVVWPLGDGRFRWSFQILGAEGEEVPRVKSRLSVSIGEDRFPFLGVEVLRELLSERAPWFVSDEASIAGEDVVWSVGVRFERRLASSFGEGRAWLVGDAAHLAGPVGMHSMNVGLAEAYALVEHVDEILHRGGGEEALATWAEGRRHEWRQLLGLDGTPRARADAPDWARRHAAQILAATPSSGEHLRLLLGQVGLELETPTEGGA